MPVLQIPIEKAPTLREYVCRACGQTVYSTKLPYGWLSLTAAGHRIESCSVTCLAASVPFIERRGLPRDGACALDEALGEGHHRDRCRRVLSYIEAIIRPSDDHSHARGLDLARAATCDCDGRDGR
jgi:hypothetical protein